MSLSKEDYEFIRHIDQLFGGRNFSYLGYEYCADPVCQTSPDNYDCPYVCKLGDEEKIDISSRYFLNLRRGFIPRRGFTWVSIDYSQIELRVAANLSGEKVWIDSFLDGEDLHRNTAKVCYHTDNPTDLQRSQSKAINFGALYGTSEYGVADSLNVDIEEAREILTSWRKGVPTLQRWLKDTAILSQQRGYSSSAMGRKRFLGKYYNTEGTAQEKRRSLAAADRQATNHAVQGCLSASTRIVTDKGYQKISEVNPEGTKVWDGKKWSTFEVLNRGPATRVNIRLSDGSIIEADDRHKLFVYQGKDIVETSMDYLKVGDQVVRNIHKIKSGNKSSKDWLSLGKSSFMVPKELFNLDLKSRDQFLKGVASKSAFSTLDDTFFRDVLKLAYVTGYEVGAAKTSKGYRAVSLTKAKGYSPVEVVDIVNLGYKEETYTLSVNDPKHRFIGDGFLHKNTAVDIMKISLIKVMKVIRDNDWLNICRPLMTIHDELDFEIRTDMLDEVIPVLVDTMTYKHKSWPVPLEVDVEVGAKWGAMEGYTPNSVITMQNPAYVEAPYILIPRRLDEDQVKMLESIIAESDGLVPVRLGYDNHIFDMTVTDVKEFERKLREAEIS